VELLAELEEMVYLLLLQELQLLEQAVAVEDHQDLILQAVQEVAELGKIVVVQVMVLMVQVQEEEGHIQVAPLAQAEMVL
jgi:hypothetical protein